MLELIKKLNGMFTTNRYVDDEEIIPLLSEPLLEPDGFVMIGKIECFIIYPIDCGPGFKFKRAKFSPNGIQMIGVENKYLLDDRTLIVYNKSTMEAMVDPIFSMADQSNEILLYCLAELFKQKYKTLEVIHVNYLGTELPLRIFPNDICEKEIQQKIFKAHKNDLLGLGYCTKEDRRLLNEKHRFKPSESNNYTDDEMKMGFLPNFSNYTLINSQSFKKLLSKKEESILNFRNFRPQIVVNLLGSFSEENIEELKINNHIFHRIIPCVTEASNYNPKCPDEKFLNVYERLRSDRTLFNIYPRFAKGRNPTLPIFGINMELKQNANTTAVLNQMVERGATISVKYFKSAFLNPSIPKPFSVPISKSVSTSASKSASIPASKSTSTSTGISTHPSISAPSDYAAALSTDSAYASTAPSIHGTNPTTSPPSVDCTADVIADPAADSTSNSAPELESDSAPGDYVSTSAPAVSASSSDNAVAMADFAEASGDSVAESVSNLRYDSTSTTADSSTNTVVSASNSGNKKKN